MSSRGEYVATPRVPSDDEQENALRIPGEVRPPDPELLPSDLQSARGQQTERTNGAVRMSVLRFRSNLYQYFYPWFQLMTYDRSNDHQPVCHYLTQRPYFFSNEMHIFDVQREDVGGTFLPTSSSRVAILRTVGKLFPSFELVQPTEDGKEIQLAAFVETSTRVHTERVRTWTVVLPRETAAEPVRIPPLHEEKEERLVDVAHGVQGKYRLPGRKYHVFRTQLPKFDGVHLRMRFFDHLWTMKASVKNGILLSCDSKQANVCQFVKNGGDLFLLDFREPVSMLQAFAFALVQFNSAV